MPIAAETRFNSPRQSIETLEREQNSFVRFIDQNKELFERHTSSTYELRDEEQGWKNSPTIDQIAASYQSLSLDVYGKADLSSRALDRNLKGFKTFVIQSISSNDNERSNSIKRQTSSVFTFQRTNSSQRAEITRLEEIVTEFRENFREAKAPLTAEVEESKKELSSNFRNYLLSDPDSIFVFKDFLSDKRHASNRETIRPFLASFAQSEDRLAKDNKVGILGEVIKKWSAEISEKPIPALLDEFVASVESSNAFEWLKFAAQGGDIVNFLKSRPVSTYPKELRDALSSFVSSKYYTARTSTEKELVEFRRSPTLKSSQQINLNPEEKRKREKPSVKAEAKEETLRKVEEEKHPIGILTKEIGSSSNIRVLTEEELRDYLQKKANSFADSDLKMVEDLENISLSLQKDPYGAGTKKLKSKTISIGNSTFPFRSINPRRRIGLSLDHPKSPETRIVYALCKNEDGPLTIVIEGIYSHDDYLSKFG